VTVADAPTSPHADAPEAPDAPDADDPVVALRTELESIGQLPVADRLERFERANAVLADELASLDEV
jgi:hypothetical protein